jgi:futalosine hydrolase
LRFVRPIMKILVIAAVLPEIDVIRDELAARPVTEIGRARVYDAVIGPTRVVLAAIGIGVVRSAAVLGALVQATAPDRVLMIGSGGALPGSGLQVGDLVVASSETMAELGLCTGVGIADAAALRLPGLSQEIRLDPDLTSELAANPSLGEVRVGRFLTVAGVSANPEQAAARARRFGALIENMEGYGLALVGDQFRIPVAELRAVSNVAGDRDKSRWKLQAANERVERAALAYLRRFS